MKKYSNSTKFIFSLAFGLSLALSQAHANWLNLSKIDSLGLNAGQKLHRVGNLDGDQKVDLVTYDPGDHQAYIMERTASGVLNQTWSHTYSGDLRGNHPGIADLDGDGKQEFSLLTRTGAWTGDIHIYESNGDDSYQQIYFSNVGVIDGMAIGDSNNDGVDEYVLAEEGFSVQLRPFQANGNDAFAPLPTQAVGGSYNANVLNPFDSDNNGLNEVLVYRDGVGSVLLENGSVVYNLPGQNVRAHMDTDGDGLGELIYNDGNLKVLESDGAGGFNTELNQASPYLPDAIDLDGDGIGEFVALLDSGSGYKDILSIGKRSGSTITEVWNSGSMFVGYQADLELPIYMGYDNFAFAVGQGETAHLVGAVPEPSTYALLFLGLLGLGLYRRKK